jgi:CRP-like cAMP-binding protein
MALMRSFLFISAATASTSVGEEALAAVAGLRLATATAITGCTALKIRREEMIRVMHEEHKFSPPMRSLTRSGRITGHPSITGW